MPPKNRLKKADDDDTQTTARTEPRDADDADQGTTRDLDPIPVEIPMADSEVKAKEADEEQQIDGDKQDDPKDVRKDKDDDKTEKSTASMLNSLRKAVDDLAGQISLKDKPARKQALLAKAQVSELSPVEFEELTAYLQNRATRKSLREDVTKSFASGGNLKKSIDASDFLTDLTSDVKKSLGDVCDWVEGMSNSNEELSLALAKSVCHISDVLAGLAAENAEMHNSINKALGAPAHAPRSVGVAQPGYVNKSFGQSNGGESLTKGQVESALTEMASLSKGGIYKGVDVHRALIKSGMNRAPDPQTMSLIQQHMAEKQN